MPQQVASFSNPAISSSGPALQHKPSMAGGLSGLHPGLRAFGLEKGIGGELFTWSDNTKLEEIAKASEDQLKIQKALDRA